jgi:flagellar basal-body rod protein FlgB
MDISVASAAGERWYAGCPVRPVAARRGRAEDTQTVLISSVVNNGLIPALDATLAFLNARLDVISENIANADTPGYRTKHLDAGAFQRALGQALERRDPRPGSPLKFSDTSEFHQNRDGKLVFTPSTEPQENLLFHDGSDMSIERQMKDLAETVMMHQTAVELLRGQYEGLKKAISGRNL